MYLRHSLGKFTPHAYLYIYHHKIGVGDINMVGEYINTYMIFADAVFKNKLSKSALA